MTELEVLQEISSKVTTLIESNESILEYNQEILAVLSWCNNVWIPLIIVLTLFWVVYSEFIRLRD